ncbi:MAG: PLP-dependent aminotransferase family protein [Rothia sp. (in: high G+C Gram-positive bacteria)]|nr:PLP-dependent aminotransferase family protein [Rothia sp. (in: high G+C Gram-positive bacteria)]
MARSSTPADLPLQIQKNSPISLPSQLAEQIRGLILSQTLTPGDSLPATRTLSARLAISRGSVVAAYEQLAGEGYVSTGRSGTKVSADLQELDAAPRQALAPGSHLNPRPSAASPIVSAQTQRARTPVMHTPAPDEVPRRIGRATPMKLPTKNIIDLRPGSPDTATIATAPWRAAWRKAAADPSKTYPAMGSPALQQQLAEHLRLMRSVVREPETIMVTAGARDAFRLVLSTLRRERRNRPLRVAVENPGYPSLHKIPATFGHEILPIAVDENGLNPAGLPTRHKPDLVLVAPSHQYPLGASMPVARRLELLTWAAEHDAYIVEDDYDSELRYVGEPLPALAALARPAQNNHTSHIGQIERADDLDRVITLGSFAKTLTPGLGLGYMLAPAQLTPALAGLRADLGSPVSAMVQDAISQFMLDGGVRRHIARMRRVYKARRNVLLTALEQEHLPGWVQVLPMDGGLHVVLKFAPDFANENTEQFVVEKAEQAGVRVAALGDYWAHSGAAENERAFGVVVGFGGVTERALERGVHLVAQSVRGAEVTSLKNNPLK